MKLALKNNIKITPKIINYSFYIFTIIITIIVIIVISIFLYKNFYLAITQSEKILTLQKLVAVEIIDMSEFNRVVNNIKQKTSLNKLTEINNPFD